MTTEDVRKIADLARLCFTDDEVEQFTQEFTKIVDYVGTIAAVDMSNVEPLSSVNDLHNVFREDVAGECLSTEEALSNAPKKNESFFKVPKVLG
ncbi:MAG: Asp-tRNA(Asn)/Glu-tRNA(Gln) amidotransferase subunit GatC [Ignavibacteriae bacterium]|jgi:aspartyl-tRNA(Asn)/glutamyl-tRNA(Gln) amidotransferase subunit C|nr:MAG: Asp-tRNA(Asn)/Glu-tRNA(Gln) amidotransferase subunit GatC [Ignavibacteriota bacterium]